MSELDFALDGLYAAGWWPSESDACLQSQDNRWYPTQGMIRANFAASGIDLDCRKARDGRPVSISWEMPGHGRETITAKSEESALLLAYAQYYRISADAESAKVGH